MFKNSIKSQKLFYLHKYQSRLDSASNTAIRLLLKQHQYNKKSSPLKENSTWHEYLNGYICQNNRWQEVELCTLTFKYPQTKKKKSLKTTFVSCLIPAVLHCPISAVLHLPIAAVLQFCIVLLQHLYMDLYSARNVIPGILTVLIWISPTCLMWQQPHNWQIVVISSLVYQSSDICGAISVVYLHTATLIGIWQKHWMTSWCLLELFWSMTAYTWWRMVKFLVKNISCSYALQQGV